MTLFSYIEERYCPTQQKNVAVEHFQMEDGSIRRHCLNRDCEKHLMANCQIESGHGKQPSLPED